MLNPIKRIKAKFDQTNRLLAENQAVAKLAQFQLGYIPWTRFALRPAVMMLHVVNEVLVNRRQSIVEFGAGISTLYLAKIVQMQGGSFLSIEDDADWAELMRSALAKEGLESCVELVVAPLKPYAV